MTKELNEEFNHMEEDELFADLLVWTKSVQLTESEVKLIKKTILEGVTEYRNSWLERMSARINRTMARSQRRIDQSVERRLQPQIDRIQRRLIGL